MLCCSVMRTQHFTFCSYASTKSLPANATVLISENVIKGHLNCPSMSHRDKIVGLHLAV